MAQNKHLFSLSSEGWRLGLGSAETPHLCPRQCLTSPLLYMGPQLGQLASLGRPGLSLHRKERAGLFRIDSFQESECGCSKVSGGLDWVCTLSLLPCVLAEWSHEPATIQDVQKPTPSLHGASCIESVAIFHLPQSPISCNYLYFSYVSNEFTHFQDCWKISCNFITNSKSSILRTVSRCGWSRYARGLFGTPSCLWLLLIQTSVNQRVICSLSPYTQHTTVR